MTTDQIRSLLDSYDACEVECDGFTRIAHHVLTNRGIEHDVYCGHVVRGGDVVSPHFWIRLPDGSTIDYRLRMWTDDTAPHGVFIADGTTKYTGQKIDLHTDPFIIEVMTGRLGGLS